MRGGVGGMEGAREQEGDGELLNLLLVGACTAGRRPQQQQLDGGGDDVHNAPQPPALATTLLSDTAKQL